jgi:hypothetical protein
MTFPEDDLPDVAKAAHAVVREAKDAGVCLKRSASSCLTRRRSDRRLRHGRLFANDA